MIKKKRYLEKLVQNLDEYYDELKLRFDAAKGHQQYIMGYLNAAVNLDVFTFEELKSTIDKAHFKAFGKPISELSKSSSDNDYFDIPAYIRQGILLDKK